MKTKSILVGLLLGPGLLSCQKTLILKDQIFQPNTVSYVPGITDNPYAQWKPAAAYETLFTDRFFANNIEQNNNWWTKRTGSTTNNGFTGYNYPANVKIETNNKNVLYLNFKEESDGKFSGGGIISRKKFGYGYYEARVNLYTATYGLHQSFWAISDAVEIDGFELDSKMYAANVKSVFSPGRHRWLPGHVVYNKNATEQANATRLDDIKNSANTGQWNYNDGQWVTLGWEWLPDKVVYYTNGVQTNEFALTDTYANDVNVYSPGNVYLTALPFDMYVAPTVTTPLDSAAMRVEYFSYSAKPLVGVNLLGNSSFEYYRNSVKDVRPDSWSEGTLTDSTGTTTIFQGNTDANYAVPDAATSTWYLEHRSPNGAAYNAAAWQTLSFIPNGNYKLTAKVKCTTHANANGFQIQVLDRDRTTVLCSRTITGPINTWTTLTINYDVATSSFIPIQVNKNEVTVLIKSIAGATETIQVDEINFQYQTP